MIFRMKDCPASFSSFPSGLLGTALLLLSSLLSTTVTLAEAGCPSPACDVCFQGALSCQQGGLTQLPDQLPRRTTKVMLVKHKFHDTTLRRANLSRYADFKLTELYIRDCGIIDIESRAFVSLKYLRLLDLSMNRLTIIRPDTFFGLALSQINLDKNLGLRLDRRSLNGLTVTKLSITDSKMTNLSLEALDPVAAKLRKLILTNNSLTTLPSSLDALFRNLAQLNLENNPFDCTCQMRWLASVYAWKARYGSQLKGNFGDTLGYPTCNSPAYLRGQKMHKILDGDNFCSQPQLQSIDVRFFSETSGTLKCAARGSPEMRVQWYYLTQQSRYVQPPNMPTAFSTIDFNRDSLHDKQHFSCLAEDTNGKSEAQVRIHWPPKKTTGTGLELPQRPPLSVPLDRNTRPSNDRSHGYEQRPPRGGENEEESEEERRRGSTARPGDSSAYLFSKQFTLLEMIGAVVGTFTITLAIFVIVYRCFVSAHRSRRKKPTYSTYEATAYSDCHTYDMPHHPPYLPPPPPPPPPLTNGQFVDYKTQKKLYNQV